MSWDDDPNHPEGFDCSGEPLSSGERCGKTTHLHGHSETRPWGMFEVIYENEHTWTKMLYIHPQQKLSLQYHDNRSERWVALDPGVQAVIGGETIDLVTGVCYTVPRQSAHRLMNPTNLFVRVLEVAVGKVDENDIVRISDKYGRK